MQNCTGSVLFSRRIFKKEQINALFCRICQGYRTSVKPTNHYETLKLPKNCTSKEIKDAFITLSKKYHPDKNKTNPKAQEEFIKISEAYNVLIKPESRREYDYTLHQFGTHRTQAPPNPSEYYEVYRQSPFARNPWNDQRGRSSQEDDNYYGVKRVRRQSNSTVLMWILIFAGIGIFLQLLAIRVSRFSHMERIHRQSDENRQYLEAVRLRAEALGTKEKQLEDLRRRFEAQNEK